MLSSISQEVDSTMTIIITVEVMDMTETVTVDQLGVTMNPVVQVNTIIITNQTEVRSISACE
jgi:hypothetical protein